MEKTLLVGDHLLVNKFIFGGRGHWYEKFLPYPRSRTRRYHRLQISYQDHPHFVKRIMACREIT